MLLKIVSGGMENKLSCAHVSIDRGPFPVPHAMTVTLCEVGAEHDENGNAKKITDVEMLAEVLPEICSITSNKTSDGELIIHVTVNLVDAASTSMDAVYEESTTSGDTSNSWRAPTDEMYTSYMQDLEESLAESVAV